MFKGSHTALITPFDGKSIDEKSFRSLIDFQISEGIHGLVPVGTTGESPTLSHEEHKLAVEICVEETAKRVPVIACLLYTSPSPRDGLLSRMPSSA